ncbi:MAG: hypothetical protein JWM80_170 [Cyanobacteria bacterium RYN_339]|nr:hypothetical protein [Cyanobacteria bacterium RYN_339]
MLRNLLIAAGWLGFTLAVFAHAATLFAAPSGWVYWGITSTFAVLWLLGLTSFAGMAYTYRHVPLGRAAATVLNPFAAIPAFCRPIPRSGRVALALMFCYCLFCYAGLAAVPAAQTITHDHLPPREFMRVFTANEMWLGLVSSVIFTFHVARR